MQSPSGSDIVINDHTHACLLLLKADLAAAIQHSPEPTTQADADTHPCPHCSKELVSAHALRIHLALHHSSHPRPDKTKCTFDTVLHSVAGMPTCKLCFRNFAKWRQLRLPH